MRVYFSQTFETIIIISAINIDLLTVIIDILTRFEE